VQQRQNFCSVGRRTVFSGLLGIFVFDILQIPGEFIQICRGCKALPPPDYGPACSGRVVFYFGAIWSLRNSFCLPPRRKSYRYPLDRRLAMVANAPAEMRTPIVRPVACHTEIFLLLDLMYQYRSSHDMSVQAPRGGGGTAPTNWQPGSRRWCVISITLRPLYPRERPDTHCRGGWVGLSAGLGGTDNLIPPGFDAWTVQPIASRQTDWTIPAARDIWVLTVNSVGDDKREMEPPSGTCFLSFAHAA
jgi:hypothetical protein